MLVLGVSARRMLRGRQAGALVRLDAATADIVLKAVLEDTADRSLLWVTHQPEELACLLRSVRAPASVRLSRPPDRTGPDRTGPDRVRRATSHEVVEQAEQVLRRVFHVRVPVLPGP
jgi:hypothetical protein